MCHSSATTPGHRISFGVFGCRFFTCRLFGCRFGGHPMASSRRRARARAGCQLLRGRHILLLHELQRHHALDVDVHHTEILRILAIVVQKVLQGGRRSCRLARRVDQTSFQKFRGRRRSCARFIVEANILNQDVRLCQITVAWIHPRSFKENQWNQLGLDFTLAIPLPLLGSLMFHEADAYRCPDLKLFRIFLIKGYLETKL
jgi:hypothetical protein